MITIDGGTGAILHNGTSINSGNIIQTVQTVKTDTANTNSGTFADISGLSVSITPTSATSKILYTGRLYIASSGSEAVFRLRRGSSDIMTGTLDDTGDGSFCHGGGSRYGHHGWEFLDSPNTTNATTYGIQWRVHSGTTYLNRTWDSGWFHGTSAITVMEIAA